MTLSTQTIRALSCGCVLLLLACGEGAAPTAETPAPTVGATPPSPIAAPSAPAAAPTAALVRGVGRLHFTVRGGVFPEPVTFDLSSDALRAMSSTSSLNVIRMRNEQDWISADGRAVLTTLIFTISVPPEPGTYARPEIDFTFDLAADRTAPRGKSVRPEGEAGTVTVTARTEDHIVGTFDVRGHATQMHSTEPVYSIRGDFAFATRR